MVEHACIWQLCSLYPADVACSQLAVLLLEPRKSGPGTEPDCSIWLPRSDADIFLFPLVSEQHWPFKTLTMLLHV